MKIGQPACPLNCSVIYSCDNFASLLDHYARYSSDSYAELAIDPNPDIAGIGVRN